MAKWTRFYHRRGTIVGGLHHSFDCRVKKLLTDEAETLEGDARRVEAMLAKLPDSVREAWKETAKEYRERARDYKSIVEAIKRNRAKH